MHELQQACSHKITEETQSRKTHAVQMRRLLSLIHLMCIFPCGQAGAALNSYLGLHLPV